MSTENAFFRINSAELKELQVFVSKEELNAAIYSHINRLEAADVPQSVLDVLKAIGASSLRIMGVSWNAQETLASAANISRSTVIRAIKTLVEFDVVEKFPTLKKFQKGGLKKSVNVMRILPLQQQVTHQDDTSVEADEANSSTECSDIYEAEALSFKHLNLNTKTLSNNKERSAGARVSDTTQPVNKLDFTYARNDIPQEFIAAVLLRSSEAKDINFAWTKVTLAYRKSGMRTLYTLESLLSDKDIMSEVCNRTRSAVRAEKLGEIREDFGALLYGTMLEMFNKIADEEYAATMSELGSATDEDFSALTQLNAVFNEEEVITRLLKRTEGRIGSDIQLSNTLVPQRDLYASSEELDALGIF